MIRALLLIPIIVILNPYEGIDYDEINVYEITEECEEKCVEVHYPEGVPEWETEDYDE